MKSSVAVIGAGTAGLVLARELAALGIKVTVYDQKQRPGFPVRASGILSVNGLNSIRVNHENSLVNILYGAKLRVGKEMLKIRSPRPQAYSLDRMKLNETCREECIKAGVRIKLGKRLEKNDILALAKENIVVGADGSISSVANAFSFPPIPSYILTYRAEYKVKALQEEQISLVELFFDKKYANGIFAWIAPNSKEVIELGVGVSSKKGNSRAAYEDFISDPYIASRLEGAELIDEGASMIPIGIRKYFVDDENEVLLVGDAAGQVKATTGGGIIFGGNGAIMAAKAISRHIKEGSKLSDYEKEWRKKFGIDIYLHSKLHSLYMTLGDKKLEALFKFIKAVKIDEFLSNYGDMDRPSLMLKRFFLRGFAR